MGLWLEGHGPLTRGGILQMLTTLRHMFTNTFNKSDVLQWGKEVGAPSISGEDFRVRRHPHGASKAAA